MQVSKGVDIKINSAHPRVRQPRPSAVQSDSENEPDMSPMPSPMFSPLSPAQLKPTKAKAGAIGSIHTNNNLEAEADTSKALSAESSPSVSLSTSLSSSFGLSSSVLGGMVSHLGAPTPSNTPNFNAAFIHRAGRGTNGGVANEALSERLRGIDIKTAPASRARPQRNRTSRESEGVDVNGEGAAEDLDFEDVGEDDDREIANTTVPIVTFGSVDH